MPLKKGWYLATHVIDFVTTGTGKSPITMKGTK